MDDRVRIIFSLLCFLLQKLCIYEKICYNSIMKNPNKHNSTAFKSMLLGEATGAKASGAVFTLAAILPTLLFLFVNIVAGAFGLLGEDPTQESWYLYASMLSIQVAFVLIVIWYFRWTKIPFKKACEGQKCPKKYYFWAIILQIGLISLTELNGLFVEWLGNFGYQYQEPNLEYHGLFGFVGMLLVVAVLPAILEETIFRGLLLKGLQGFGNVRAIWICGALFALYHQNPAQTIYQFFCGAAFALVALKSGSILPTVVSHFFNNAFVLILNEFFKKMEITVIPMPIYLTMLIICFACLILALYYFIFKHKGWACVQRNEKVDKKTQQKQFLIFAMAGIIICAASWIAMLF